MQQPNKSTKKQNFSLITGATGGLGRAFTLELASQNHNLFLTGTNNDKLDSLKKEILEKYPDANIVTHACDLSNHESRLALIQEIKNKNIYINYLVNNAGYITEGSIEYAKTEDLLKCVQVNCEGTIHLTKTLVDNRDKNELMRIVCITSMASNYPMPYMAIYASTKALLRSFMISLREEYKKQNVKVLIVEPGAIATSEDMKLAIKAQGLKGKMSSVAPEIIAKKAIKKSFKNKSRYIPGFFNKVTIFVSNLAPTKLKTKAISKMWRKSQKKIFHKMLVLLGQVHHCKKLNHLVKQLLFLL